LLSNKHINFIELSLKTVQSSRLNLYSCKYSSNSSNEFKRQRLTYYWWNTSASIPKSIPYF